MRKLAKDRVYDMLERTNKVEAEKTELSAQKIELASISEVKAVIKKYNDSMKEADDVVASVRKLVSPINRYADRLKKQANKMDGLHGDLFKVLQSMKELGEEIGISEAALPREYEIGKKMYNDHVREVADVRVLGRRLESLVGDLKAFF